MNEMRELTDAELESVSGGGLVGLLLIGVATYVTVHLAVDTAIWLLDR